MMKRACLLFCLCVFSNTMYAEPADPCAALADSALVKCRSDQQALRQQQLERELQQQEQRQNQLDQQQREVQQQLESMRLQNEALRTQLREMASQPPQPVATAESHPSQPTATSYSRSAELSSAEIKNWTAENPWYGSDYPRTEFALRYAKQLKKERPDLTGRPLLDAIATKVNATFGDKH
jgi:TolA-binding protein